MPAASLEAWNGQRGQRRIEQRPNRGRLHVGMIDQREQHALGGLRNHPQAALHRGELAQPVVAVLGEEGPFRLLHTRADALGVAAEHHHYRRAESGEQIDQPVQKRFAAQFQQRLRRSHTFRFTRGQNQSGDTHFSSARSDSSAKMDMERSRQPDCGLRRAAIISAATEMAISSGAMAPISRPIGA